MPKIIVRLASQYKLETHAHACYADMTWLYIEFGDLITIYASNHRLVVLYTKIVSNSKILFCLKSAEIHAQLAADLKVSYRFVIVQVYLNNTERYR